MVPVPGRISISEPVIVRQPSGKMTIAFPAEAAATIVRSEWGSADSTGSQETNLRTGRTN